MRSFESIEADGFEAQPERIKRIENLNRQSFLMTEGGNFQVLQSLHSVGARRDVLTEELADTFDAELIARAKKIGRVELAGNVSPLNGYGPNSLEPDERKADAIENINEFLIQNDINQADVRMLRPERDYTTPLTVVNLDTEPLNPDDAGLLRPDTAGDMMYTYNADIIPAARPADCPIVFLTAETPKGEVTVLLHLAWQGVAHGYIQQAKEALDDLEADWDSVRAQITPGGQAETFKFENFNKYNPHTQFPEYETMFVDVEEVTNELSEPVYNFSIDLSPEVYERIIDTWGIDEYQLFLDTTDTTSPSVGYSSHSRSFKKYDQSGENSRDLVLARRNK